MEESQEPIIYRINASDEIVAVNAAWDRFAIANNAIESTAQYVLNRSLWGFFSGSSTKYLYREIILQVRAGRSMQFDLRCDSPEVRRLLKLRIAPSNNDEVTFESRTISVEERRAPAHLCKSTESTGTVVAVCSWCNKIRTSEKSWLEAEEAVRIRGFFELDSTPRLSHGVCEACYDAVSSKIKNRSVQQGIVK